MQVMDSIKDKRSIMIMKQPSAKRLKKEDIHFVDYNYIEETQRRATGYGL